MCPYEPRGKTGCVDPDSLVDDDDGNECILYSATQRSSDVLLGAVTGVCII